MSVARSDLGYAPDRSGNAYAIGGLDDNGQPLSSAERLQSGLGHLGRHRQSPDGPIPFPGCV